MSFKYHIHLEDWNPGKDVGKIPPLSRVLNAGSFSMGVIKISVFTTGSLWIYSTSPLFYHHILFFIWTYSSSSNAKECWSITIAHYCITFPTVLFRLCQGQANQCHCQVLLAWCCHLSNWEKKKAATYLNIFLHKIILKKQNMWVILGMPSMHCTARKDLGKWLLPLVSSICSPFQFQQCEDWGRRWGEVAWHYHPHRGFFFNWRR